MSTYPELDSLEIERLKNKIAELEMELSKARSILRSNDLEEETANISDAEIVCVNEIHKLKVASDHGILTLEDVKVLDIWHKNLLLARGKQVEDKKDKKRGTKSVAELLSIVDRK